MNKEKTRKRKYRQRPGVRRDRQRVKYYRFEEQAYKPLCKDPLTIEQCRDLVAQVWSDYGIRIRRPAVQLSGRRYARATYYGDRHEITLPRWALLRWVVLHEVAHALIDQILGFDSEPHGARFAGLHLDLLIRYGLISEDRRPEYEKMAADHGVRIAYGPRRAMPAA